MGSNQTFLNRVGLVKLSDWHSLLEPGANTGIWTNSIGVPKGDRKTSTNEEEDGRGGATKLSVFEYNNQSGTLPGMKVYFETLEPLYAGFFGSYDSDELVPAEVYRHKIPLATTLNGTFFALGFDGATVSQAINALKFNSMKVQYNDGLHADFGFVASKPTRQPGWSNPLGITYKSDGVGTFKLLNSGIYVRDVDGNDFDENDKLNANEVDFDITRKIEGSKPGSGYDCTDEPLDALGPTTKLNLGFASEDQKTDAFHTAFENEIEKKVRLRFEGPEIPGGTGQKYTFELNLPIARLLNPPDITYKTPKPWKGNFQALNATSLPVGMECLTPYLVIINKIPPLTGYPVPA